MITGPTLEIEIRGASDGGLFVRCTAATGTDGFRWVATRYVPIETDAQYVDDLARGLVGFHEAGVLGFVSALSGEWT